MGFLKKFFHVYLTKRSCGYTLIEILVAIAVVGVITGVSIAIYLSVASLQQQSITINDLQSEGTVIIEKMSRVIRDARSVKCGESCNTLIVHNFEDSLEYQTSGSCLTTTFVYFGPTANDNGKIEKQYSNCSVATSTETLTNTDVVKGISVKTFLVAVSDYSEAYPQTVDIALTLERGVKATKRASRVEVLQQTRVSTRAY